MNDGVVSIESIGTGDIMVEYISQELSGMNDNAFKDMEIPIEGGHIEDAVRSSRLHKLEQERRDLLDELTSLKESHIYTQHELSTTHNELQKLKEKSLQDMTSLNDQLHQFEYENKSLKERNIYNEKQLESVIDQYELKITELTESKDIIARELRVLQGKAHDHHVNEMKQLNLEKTIRRLERKISQQEDEERLGVTLYDRIHKYHELVQNNKELLEENKILRSRIENVELLTHQIQSLRGKCSRLEGEKINYQNLQTENQLLKEKLQYYEGGGDDSGDSKSRGPLVNDDRSPNLMSLHLNQLRQKEVILTKRNGELQTDLTIANNSLSDAKNQLVSLQEQISTLQNELQARNDAIVKLERRIQFLTKERDGCIHVLNSYRRDDGASSILKEQVNELEVSNGRLNERIKELESQLDNIQRKR